MFDLLSETSLLEWLFCCIPIFCFSILFMFLLSFSRETLWALHYVVQGEGFPIVLIHGFGASTFQI